MEVGDKINNLTLKEKYTKRGRPYGIFECDCPEKTTKEIRVHAVTSQNTKSCGCHRKKMMTETGKKARTHGLSHDYIYTKWMYYKTNFELCHDWQDFQTFYNQIGYQLNETLGLIFINKEEPISLTNYNIVPINDAKTTKKRITSKEKYGVDSPTQLQSVKDKMAATNLETYGYKCALANPEIKEQIKQTNIEKYGADHHMKTPFYAKQARERTIDNGQANLYQGKTGTQWAQELGLSQGTMNRRIKKFGAEKAVSMPKYQSSIESIIEDFLLSKNINFVKQYPVDKFYADFFLPDNKIIIECDGLYWHSDIKKDKNYHLNKKKLYTDRGFRSFFFYEDEIEDQLEIVKSIIGNSLGFSSRIYARKCEIKELDLNERKKYFSENHLMGVGQGKASALLYDDEIVCALQHKTTDYVMNIERFCPRLNTSVVGGFSRLLKHVEELVEHKTVKTFIDLRYGQGNYLKDLGFKLDNNDISFNWIKDDNRVHRLQFPGNTGYDQGWNKIWDCGQAKWIKS